MTYQEIVNRIQDVVNQHYMLAGFGYGDLSDLKTRFENTSGDDSVQADYPYLFLNPATHNRTRSAVTYNFNMLVMDLPRGEVSDNPYDNILAIQSQCQQYIDDVIAYLWDGYDDPPQVLYDGLSYNTFNERFQDDVAGMTVNLSIMVPQPINNCITPFPSTVPPPVPTPISIEVTEGEATNEACNNGTITFRISGGSLPQVLEYNGSSYNITNQVGTILQTSNETVGTRTWTITENDGTVHTGQVSIICTYEPVGSINITVAATDATDQFCSDGSVTFTVSGGSLPQTLRFDNNSQGPDVILTEPVNVVEYLNLGYGTYEWTITEFDGTVHSSTVEVICTNPDFTITITGMTGSSGGSWSNQDATDAYCAFVDAVEPFEYQFFKVKLVDLPLLVGTQLYDLPFGDPSNFTGTIIYSDEPGLITPETAVNPKAVTIVNGIVDTITEGSSIVCQTEGVLVVDVFSNKTQQFNPDISQAPLTCQVIVLTDGGWREDTPGVGGNYYIPQTSNNYNWRVSGTVTFTEVNPNDSFRPFEIQDVGNGNLYPPSVNIGWPTTTPTVGQPYSYVLEYYNIPWSGNNFEAVNVIDTAESQARFTTSAETNIKIYRID